MQYDHSDDRCEELYEELLARFEWLHQRNKRRVRQGAAVMLAVTVGLFLVRWMTDSDKVVFLLLWIFCFVVAAGYLIGVEYLDYMLQEDLKKMTGDEDAEIDGLIRPAGGLGERIAMRLARRQEEEPDEPAEDEAPEDSDEPEETGTPAESDEPAEVEEIEETEVREDGGEA